MDRVFQFGRTRLMPISKSTESNGNGVGVGVWRCPAVTRVQRDARTESVFIDGCRLQPRRTPPRRKIQGVSGGHRDLSGHRRLGSWILEKQRARRDSLCNVEIPSKRREDDALDVEFAADGSGTGTTTHQRRSIPNLGIHLHAREQAHHFGSHGPKGLSRAGALYAISRMAGRKGKWHSLFDDLCKLSRCPETVQPRRSAGESGPLITCYPSLYFFIAPHRKVFMSTRILAGPTLVIAFVLLSSSGAAGQGAFSESNF